MKRQSRFGRDDGRINVPQRKRRRRRSNDDCATPPWLYKALHAEFRFDLDPCPLKPKSDGLSMDWDGHRIFCNPPYSKILPWVQKALSARATTVLVLPARFDSMWSRLLRDHGAEFRIFCGDVRFTNADGRESHPFGGTMIVIVRRARRSLDVVTGGAK